VIRYVLLAIFLLIAGCAKEVPAHRYSLRGEILRLDPAAHTATIKHEKIDGWMEAMTMEFPVRDSKEFAALRTGEHITATVFVTDSGPYWVSDIHEDTR
jgi:protein SCO1/2